MVTSWLGSGGSERMIFVILLNAVHSLCWILINGMFATCDAYGFLAQYKMDRTQKMEPTRELYMKTVQAAAVGQLIVSPLISWFVYDVFKYFGMPALDSALPAFHVVWGHFIAAHLANEWGFYWSHRAFHHRSIYKYVHKQHHTYVGTVGVAAEYAHPLEGLLSNQLPTLGGCVFSGAHPIIYLVWLASRLQQTYEGHSGYCFKGSLLQQIGLTNSSAAAYHDHHHTGNRGNFGSEYLDYFCGTMDAWVQDGGEDGYLAKKKKTT